MRLSLYIALCCSEPAMLAISLHLNSSWLSYIFLSLLQFLQPDCWSPIYLETVTCRRCTVCANKKPLKAPLRPVRAIRVSDVMHKLHVSARAYVILSRSIPLPSG